MPWSHRFARPVAALALIVAPLLLTTQRTSALTLSPALRQPGTIAAGTNHTCVVLADRTASCWGSNSDGQLGNSDPHDTVTPKPVSGLADIAEIAAGGVHTCARTTPGQVWCWGHGPELGDGVATSTPTPVAVAGLANATMISTSRRHTCAIRTDRSVWCWGINGAGQLGDASFQDRTEPVAVLGLTDAVYVSAGAFHTCAAKTDGHVWCWGSNGGHQLGNPAAGPSPAPVEVPGVVDAVAVAAGYDHSCALSASGTVTCWGWNNVGQLGLGSIGTAQPPTAVPSVADVVEVDAGSDSTCARTRAGLVMCWGDPYRGQLGVSPSTPIGVPAEVIGVDDAVALVTGLTHSCVLSVGGSVRCWGDSTKGEVGSGLPALVSTPTTIPGLTGVEGIVAGDGLSCAILINGTAQCWGSNESGQLGVGDVDAHEGPVEVQGLYNVAQIDVNANHACAVLDDGTARCWGLNNHGQLGDGTTNPALTPATVAGLNDVVGITTGFAHTCARLADRTLDCWGYGVDGELGLGASISDHTSPTPVPSITDADTVTAGSSHTCTRLGSGAVWCWGSNYAGQIGDRTFNKQNSPVQIDVLNNSNFVHISAGDIHTCASRAANTWCWGDNSHGQLGDSSGSNQPSPVVAVGAGGGDVQAGGQHTCVLNSSGTVKCWGDNGVGQLGVTGIAFSPVAIDVPGIAGAIELAAGRYQTCAVMSDTTVSCWGYNWNGELGQPSYFPVPAEVVGVTGLTPSLEIPLVPARLLDTRPGEATIDGQYAGHGQQPAGSTLELPITGRGGVPTGVASAVVNVTAVNAIGPGFVTVYPCDTPRPLASSLNYTPGTITPNEVVAKLSAAGTICLYTLADVDLVVDVTGWVPSTPGYTPLVPTRLLDTRPGEATIDGQYAGHGQQPAGSTLELAITGRGGVPAGVASAVINVTAVNAIGPGFATVYPCDTPRPLASSLNYTPGTTTPNELIAKLSATGTICIYTLAGVDLVVDVTGVLPTTPGYTALVPARLLDTRPGESTIDGQYSGQGQLHAGTSLELPITGRGGVPTTGAAAAVVNVTAVDAGAPGFVTVYPCDAPRPLASSLNYADGAATPNEVIAKLSAAGTICLYSLASVDLVVDVTGWLR